MSDPSKPSETPLATPDTTIAISILPHPSGALLVALSLRCGDLSAALSLAPVDAIALGENLIAAGRQAATGLVVAQEIPPNPNGGRQLGR